MSALFTKLYIAQRNIIATPCVTIHGPEPTQEEIEAEIQAKIAASNNFGMFGALEEPTDQVNFYIVNFIL